MDDPTWRRNIDQRNKQVAEGAGGSDYYLDEGLMNKMLSRWETPAAGEIDVWYTLKRD